MATMAGSRRRSLRLEPVFNDQAGHPEKVPHVVSDAYDLHRNRLCGDQRVRAPDLPAGLAQIALDRKRLSRCCRVKCGDAHQLEVGLEGDAFCPRFTRAGNPSPDFYRSQSRYCEGTLRSGRNAMADILVSGFGLEECFDDAGIEQVFHRLK